MTELAFSGLGYNPMTATPPCVNDPDAVPGGSSSGAAASVAFGLAPAGIGSDTGGSVRVPSAWNDLVGLKTTAGRLPLEGVVPLCAKFDTVGPLCRSVEDAALLLAALEGGTAGGPARRHAGGRAVPDPRHRRRWTSSAPRPRDGFEQAPWRGCGSRGRDDRAGRGPGGRARRSDLPAILFATEAYGDLEGRDRGDPDAMFPQILERFRGGAAFAGADYVAAWLTLDALRRDWLAATAATMRCSCPTVADPAAEAWRPSPGGSGAYYVSENLLALRNTRIANLMGLAGADAADGRAVDRHHAARPADGRRAAAAARRGGRARLWRKCHKPPGRPPDGRGTLLDRAGGAGSLAANGAA